MITVVIKVIAMEGLTKITTANAAMASAIDMTHVGATIGRIDVTMEIGQVAGANENNRGVIGMVTVDMLRRTRSGWMTRS